MEDQFRKWYLENRISIEQYPALTEEQQKILKGEICPYCKGKSEYVDSSVIYGKSYGMIYLCRPCDAYVGVHKGTSDALGRMGNRKLRTLKKEAHLYFDVIWKEGHFKRKDAYRWLSVHLGIPKTYTHIGHFSEETLKKVIYLSKQFLNDMRRADIDNGIDVKRPHYDL